MGDHPARIHFPTFTRELKYDGRGRKFVQRDLLGVDEEYIPSFSCDPAGRPLCPCRAPDLAIYLHGIIRRKS